MEESWLFFCSMFGPEKLSEVGFGFAFSGFELLPRCSELVLYDESGFISIDISVNGEM